MKCDHKKASTITICGGPAMGLFPIGMECGICWESIVDKKALIMASDSITLRWDVYLNSFGIIRPIIRHNKWALERVTGSTLKAP